MNHDQRPLVPKEVAAALLGISTRTLDRLQEIPRQKVGGSVRYRPADIDAYIASRRTGGK